MNEQAQLEYKDAMESVPYGDIGDYKCPVCHEPVEEIHQADGPDDFEVTGVACTDCEYRYDY